MTDGGDNETVSTDEDEVDTRCQSLGFRPLETSDFRNLTPDTWILLLTLITDH